MKDRADAAGALAALGTPCPSETVAQVDVVCPTESMAPDTPSHRRMQGAFELKFLVEPSRAAAIREWARRNLDPDPYANPELVDGYGISSVYLDTPQLDIYHRNHLFKLRKYRLRRYGCEPILWLEQKKKRSGRVLKRRFSVDDSRPVEHLLAHTDQNWEGDWFRRRVSDLRLSPVTAVTYYRTARVGSSAAGPIRLTVDANIRIATADGWQVHSCISDAAQVLPDRQIVELKFREFLPTVFRQLIQEFELLPTTFSKYRESVEVCRHSVSGKSHSR